MDLEFDVYNQFITRTDSNEIVNWNQQYLRLLFTFKTRDWCDVNCFVQFHGNGRTYELALVDDVVTVPAPVLTGDRFSFTLYGAFEDYRITANQVLVRLRESGYTTDVSPLLPVDEDIFVQIFSELARKADIEDISTVGFTGDYGDLLNAPDLPLLMGSEVKASFRQLANRIRTTSANAEH